RNDLNGRLIEGVESTGPRFAENRAAINPQIRARRGQVPRRMADDGRPLLPARGALHGRLALGIGGPQLHAAILVVGIDR
ncbi:hypothetical protein NQ214_23560, partial [Escherichia coli]|nr:hypothetical protein [Escherichia coli]